MHHPGRENTRRGPGIPGLIALVFLFAAASLPAGNPTLDGIRPVNDYAVADTRNDNWPTVAADDEGNAIAMWSPGSGFCDLLLASSHNGGATWSPPRSWRDLSSPSVFGRGLSPELATDGRSTWIATWLAPAPSFSFKVVVARSDDSGMSWAVQTVSDTVSGYPEPRLATDRDGRWIVFWEAGPIHYTRSTDDGISWDPPEVLIAGDDPDLAADGQGNWIFVWDTGTPSGSNVQYSVSTDDGDTWTHPAQLNDEPSPSPTLDIGPRIATDGAGAWVVAWLSNYDLGGAIGDDIDVLYSRSTDVGSTWSPSAALNSDADTDDASQFSPTLAANAGGQWLAAWRAFDYEGILGAQSVDGGVTWAAATPLHAEGLPAGGVSHPVLAAPFPDRWLLTWRSSHEYSGFGSDMDVLSSRFRLPFDPTCATDADADGFGAPGDASCPRGAQVDCDDAQPDVSPGATQVCDGLNNDCSHPSWPALVAINESDDDGDGLSECAGDCDDQNVSVWATPGVVSTLRLAGGANGPATLVWDAPAPVGGDPGTTVYDVVRSESPYPCWELNAQTCLATDTLGLSVEDPDVPQPGTAVFYLVRAENTCPGRGVVGLGEQGTTRLVRECD